MKLYNIMKDVGIGVMRETIFEDPLNRAFNVMTRAGFNLMTNVERLNQGELVYGFMKGIHPDIFAAYDSFGKVKPGMEEKAMQPWDMEALRNYVEGIQGYYGFGRAPYNYFMLGRLMGMFRFPWQIALVNNILGKFKVDGTLQEKVGYMRACWETIGSVGKMVLKSSPGLYDDFQKLQYDTDDTFHLFKYLLGKTDGVIDNNRWDRFNNGIHDLPKAYKKALASAATSFLVVGSLVSLLLARTLQDNVLMHKGKSGKKVPGTDAMNLADLVYYMSQMQLAEGIYSKNKRSLTQLSREESIEHQDNQNEIQTVLSLLGDVLGITVIGNTSHISPTLVQVKRIGKIAMDIPQTIEGTLAKTISAEERQKLLYYLSTNGRKGFIPEHFPKILYDALPWVPYGLGNVVLSGEHAYRNYINPGVDWDERKAAEKHHAGSSHDTGDPNDMPPDEIPNETPNEMPQDEMPPN